MAQSYLQYKDLFGFNFPPSSDTTAPVRSIVINGENRDIDTTTTPETVWEIGGTYVFPTASSTASLVSDSANDDVNGTGAQYVYLEGLDSNYREISETIALDGLTPSVGSVSFFRINNARVVLSGTNKSNVGNITITVNSKSVRYIAVGECLDHTAVYTVPTDHHFFILSSSYGANRAASPGYATISTSVYIPATNSIYTSSQVAFNGEQVFQTNHAMAFPRINEKSDIFYNVEYVSANNTDLGISVRGFLVYKSWIPSFTK